MRLLSFMVNLMAQASENWMKRTFSYPDTRIHEERFIDGKTNTPFTSVGIILEAPSTNSSAVEYSFSSSGEFDSIAAGGSLTLTDKAESRIYIRLGTANDSFIVRAW